jgi:hypothetical protein
MHTWYGVRGFLSTGDQCVSKPGRCQRGWLDTAETCGACGETTLYRLRETGMGLADATRTRRPDHAPTAETLATRRMAIGGVRLCP